MLKTLAIAAFLALPLVAQAAEPAARQNAAAVRKANAAPKPAASAASAAPVTPETARQAQQRGQTRGSAMGRCLQLALDQGLQGVERKQFLGTCVRQPQ